MKLAIAGYGHILAAAANRYLEEAAAAVVVKSVQKAAHTNTKKRTQTKFK